MDEVDISELSESSTSRSSLRRNLITRKVPMYFLALFIATGALALILFSPLLLRQLTRIKGIDWSGLSNIGQTYGAASAILSGIALIGISLSLLVQARQARTERVRITRERHMELLRIVLDAPNVYGPVIGLSVHSTRDYQQFLFCTMWVNYVRMGFQMGVLTEEILREDIFGPAFTHEPMRKWWVAVRKYWRGDLVQGGKERKLTQIIDEEYRKAAAAGPPIMLNTKNARADIRTTLSPQRLNVLAGTALGIALGILLGSRRHRNQY
jgi:hypothetical protein